MHPSLRRRGRPPQTSSTPTNSIRFLCRSENLVEIQAEIRDWSNLNSDLLEMILDHLALAYHLKFGMVCRSWRSARVAHGTRTSFLVPQFPLLMYPAFTLRSNRHVLNLSSLCYSTFTLKDLCANKCIGSSGSWLIMRSCYFLTVYGYRVYLYNPSTITRIMLPKLECWYQSDELVACSKPGTSDMAIIYFSISRGHSFLFYLRYGDRRWSRRRLHVPGYNNIRIIQAVAIGHLEFYVLTCKGWLGHIKLNRYPLVVWKTEIGKVQFDEERENAYLVECSPNKLLVVITNADRRRQLNDQAQQCFRVFMLDLTVMSGWISVKVEDVTLDRLLFLGLKGSLYIPVPSVAHAISTQVYIAGEKSVEMYDLKTGELSVCAGANTGSSSGIWILPQPLSRKRKLRWWLWVYNIVEVCLLPSCVIQNILLAVAKIPNIPVPLRHALNFVLVVQLFEFVAFFLLLPMILITEIYCNGGSLSSFCKNELLL